MKNSITKLWPIPVQLLAIIATVLKEHGISTKMLLEGTSVTEQVLFESEKLLSYRLTFQIMQRAFQLSPVAHLGMIVGERQSPSGMGLLGYVINCCTSAEDAMNMAVKYHRVSSTLVSAQWYKKEEQLFWIANPPINLGAILPLVIEEEFSSLCRAFLMLTGKPIELKEIHFQYPEPKYVEAYKKLFNCPLFFSANDNKIIMSSSLLEQPILQANPLSVDAAERMCIEFLENNPITNDLVLIIHQLILNNDHGFMDEESVASKLNLTSRTLRNQLNSQGTNFQNELNNVKQRTAINLLLKTNQKISRIAEKMGYSDARSFRRAFKKWTSKTPIEFRNQNI